MSRERPSDKRPPGFNSHLLSKREPAPSAVKLIFGPQSGAFIGFVKRTPEEIADIERERENKTRKENNTND